MFQLSDGQLLTIADARLLFSTGSIFRATVQCFLDGDMRLVFHSRVGMHNVKTARGELKVYKSIDKLNWDMQQVTGKSIQTFEITLPSRD